MSDKPILWVDEHKLRSGQCWPNEYASDHAQPGLTPLYTEEYVRTLQAQVDSLQSQVAARNGVIDKTSILYKG